MSYAYYRFFTGDYMRDTMHLGWFEDLAYRRLIDLYLLHGKPIRNDRAYIMRAVRAFEPEQQAAVDMVLAEFFELKATGWHQRKCDAELTFRANESARGLKGANARWGKNNELDASAMRPQCTGNANQNQNQNQITPKSTPSCASDDARFVEFWTAYPRKKSKGQALKAWKRLAPSADLLRAILTAITTAKASQDWKRDNGQFIPYPATWLNARGWEDEHPEEKTMFPV